jgi:hypothetical protein
MDLEVMSFIKTVPPLNEWAAFFTPLHENSVSRRWDVAVRTRVPPWRRSAGRTCLPAKSLLTGNFTGKFAISQVQEAILEQESAVPQGLFEQFPTKINREKIWKIREFQTGIREFFSRDD